MHRRSCARSVRLGVHGTSNTLTRGQVRGGGKKPWRQKGTGRARQGYHPRPSVGWRRYRVRSAPAQLRPSSVQQQGRSSWPCAPLSPPRWPTASSSVVDEFIDFEKPCTKDAVALIKAHGLRGPAHHAGHRQRGRRPRGCPSATSAKVNILPVAEANTYELLDNKAAGVHR